MTDYIACGRVVPERIAAIVKGIAEACVVAGCALIGGETAEHPGLLDPDEYDVAGATTGVVEADSCSAPAGSVPATWSSRWSPAACTPTATPSSATCCCSSAGWALDRDVDELGRTLGEELLEPTRIYAKACLDLADRDRAPTRCPTSPVAGSPPTSSGCCPRSSPSRSTAPPGRRSRSSTLVAGSARCPAGRPRGHAQLGVGMVALTAARRRRRGARRAGQARHRGLGRAARSRTDADNGGRVALVGQHPGW